MNRPPGDGSGRERNLRPAKSVGKHALPLESESMSDPRHPSREPASGHPPGARLEAFAAGELRGEVAREVEGHLAGCARCRAEVEGWTLLFGDLSTLPERSPSGEFVGRVMAEIQDLTQPEPAHRPAPPSPSPSGLRALVDGIRDGAGDLFWGGIRALRGPKRLPAPALREGQPGGSGIVRHLTPTGIQDFLEGQLAPRTELRVREHLSDCTDCSGQVEAWSLVMARLDALPRLAPRPEFADAVMARVEVQAVAAVAAREARTRSWVGALGAWALSGASRLVPSTRRGWIAAGTLVAMPTLGLVVLVAAVVSNPVVGMGDLVTFLGWRIIDALGSLAAGTLALFTETRLAAALWQALLAFVQASPLALSLFFLLTTGGVAAATFVVYRNLYRPHDAGEPHVQALP